MRCLRALALVSHAFFAIWTSRSASSGVSPCAEQNFKSGMSAIQHSSSSLQNRLMWWWRMLPGSLGKEAADFGAHFFELRVIHLCCGVKNHRVINREQNGSGG
jgi:hypothetical protein